MILFLLVYIAAGFPVIVEAFRGLRDGEFFGECLLMTVATFGALILGEYAEACAVMIFYRAGEFLADYASEKTRKNVSSLIKPDRATLENGESVDPSQVPEGSIIIVKPDEKVPIDGVVVEGRSNIDTSALTGESLPREVEVDNEVLSGSVNLSSVLKLKTTRTFSQSTVSKILELIESAEKTKSSSEKFITRFAKIYTPSVLVLALIIAAVPSVLTGNVRTWAYRALVFLSVSCPCALIVSVPLAFFAALGTLGKRGMLVKGGIFIERLSEVSTMIFDKTGTLTKTASNNVKENASAVIHSLKSEGVKRIIMLTGDSHSSAKKIADSLGITEYYSGLLPLDKVNKLKEAEGKAAFVGDGINDAPVLTRADVGIAMGAMGSRAAIEAADVVIMDDDLSKLPEALRISRTCMKIVRQNVFGSIAVKAACLVLGGLNLVGMGGAVFADVGVMLLAVLNSSRIIFRR